ncbi:MAG TPA: serine acetyltransferase [Candidatus Erysipelatoclostridium merdavium]|uniref:Serine acetyltransferase n=1 Tax=Candidatus Erysipelatoclostridium merdavium TaxID=2838566 RepID=A0A9D2BL04_9FIRM|nr:serine acetyltransferase [Candidatus Erysipelatoclostridium merdavium]
MEKINYLKEDKKRYSNGRVPYFQYAFRKAQSTKIYPFKIFYLILLRIFRRINCVELPAGLKVGAGLYFGHPYCITINPKVVIGNHVNIHKGVSIGQENRGKREGVPVIGNNVWIGMNATIVGKVCIGDDVLIAPNSFVNCDVPSHSIVLGNPCIIKHSESATYGYL